MLLPDIPKEKEYEEYISAYLQAGGMYVERNLIYRETEELLELDILITKFGSDSTEKTLVEIKSGLWGFHDIFKVKGWLVYLGYEKGCFIVQSGRPGMRFFQDKARILGIDLIDDSDLLGTKDHLSNYLLAEPDDTDVLTIRLSYLLERKQLQKLKLLKRIHRDMVGYGELDDYFHKVNCKSLFFSRNPISRIENLFAAYINYKNISARICGELEGNGYDLDVETLSRNCYQDTFFKAKNNVYQLSLFIEHLTRVTILKCSIEHLIIKLEGKFDENSLENALSFLHLPGSILNGLNAIVQEEYFYLYPIFWQWFTYAFGGFILTDLKDREYALLSKKTGIPINEVPNAFDAFNKLFPRPDGWFVKVGDSNIERHMLFPLSFSGIGANYRRLMYAEDNDYKTLYKMLTGYKTAPDLAKWNNLAYRIITDSPEHA